MLVGPHHPLRISLLPAMLCLACTFTGSGSDSGPDSASASGTDGTEPTGGDSNDGTSADPDSTGGDDPTLGDSDDTGGTDSDSDSDSDTDSDGSDESTGTGGEPDRACSCFDGSLTVPVLEDAETLQVADLDGDGNLDLVLASRLGNTVQLHFGDGAGGFDPVDLPVTQPNALDIGDMDGDGDLDLVLLENATLTVQLNDGNGTFTDSGTAAGISYPTALLELGDLDGDGDLDVVTGNYSNFRMLRVFSGDGSGGLTESANLQVGYQPVDLQLVDVDDDGNLDIAVRGSDKHGLVTYGDGTGTFDSGDVRAYAGPDRYDGGARFGDVDEDGNLDWVMLGRDRSWIRRGTGSGSGITTELAPAELLPTDGTSDELRLVDLNDDGHLDILASVDGDVVVRTGDGTGGFSGPAIVIDGSPDSARDLAHGDLNGDGTLDIVSLDPDENRVVIAWGAPDDSVPACEAVCGAGTCGDGQVDQLHEDCDGQTGCTACAWDPTSGCGDRVLVPGELCYAEADIRAAAHDWEVHGIDGADLDGDGRGDLVVGMRDNQYPSYDNAHWGVYWDLGEGAVQWSNHSGHMTDNYSWDCRSDPRVAITQLNQNTDTLPDFVIACHNPGIASALVRGLGTGTTSFNGVDEFHEDFHSPMDAVMGDFDEDGDLDVATASTVLGGHLGINNGGGYVFAADRYSPATQGRRVGSADVDGDNDLDLFLLRENGTLIIYLGDGTGLFPVEIEIPTSMDEMHVVDIDQDGNVDVVGSHHDGDVYVALGDGMAGFMVQGPYPVGEGAVTSIAPLEADGDGHLDLVVTSNGGVSVLQGFGDGSFADGVTVYSASGMKDTFTDDVDGDGRDDIFATRSHGGDGTMVFLRSDP